MLANYCKNKKKVKLKKVNKKLNTCTFFFKIGQKNCASILIVTLQRWKQLFL